jgi:thiamine biosynthesis protein ThiI
MTYLIKLGELTLKGGNKAGFEKILSRNLAQLLRAGSEDGSSCASFFHRDGRYYIEGRDDAEASAAALFADERIEYALSHLAGITGWAATRKCEKNIDDVIAACIAQARVCFENGAASFKCESRRTDKSFPLRSYQINCKVGDAISAAFPAMKVDVKKPEAVISIEIREKAFVYGYEKKGLRGLPVGTAGRGLLLLSGGIDSPVAGFMMALRGMSLSALYFHAYPYTSDDAKNKVLQLAKIIAPYSIGMKVFVVSFTEVEKRIHEKAPHAWATVLLRMAMMECASLIARRNKCKALVTGESLSQVASQTTENMNASQSRATLPVFRPLIGMDKEEITARAIKIGTYQTSILPFQDCCALFSPQHPILRASLEEAGELYDGLELGCLIMDAIHSKEIHKMGV